MDQPQSVNKRMELLFFGIYLLAMDAVLIAVAAQKEQVFNWIMVALVAMVALVLIYFCNSKVTLDEHGLEWVSMHKTTRYSWEKVEQVGIEKELVGHGRYNGIIVLIVNGKKKRLPYTKNNIKCIRRYYGEPDYDKWGEEPMTNF